MPILCNERVKYKVLWDNADSIINQNELIPILPNCFVLKCYLLFASAAYIQMYFRLDFIMEANAMNPAQTDAKKAFKSRSILMQYMLPKRLRV